MIRWAAFLLIGLFLSACGGSKPEPIPRPSYVLPDDSLVLILTEVHMASATYQHRDVRRNRLQDFARAEYYHVFDSFGIEPKRLDSSLIFYKHDPLHMEAVYDEVLNILSTRLAEAKADPNVSKQDSLELEDGSAEERIKELENKGGKRIKGTKLTTENGSRSADPKRQRSPEKLP